MGKKSRVKGRAFEQKIARILRDYFPELADEIRRSDQGHGAALDDVTGIPHVWHECEDAENGKGPLGKLAQAINDAPPGKIPVAITHKKRAKTIEATLQLRDLVLLFLLARAGPAGGFGCIPVTLDLRDYLRLLKSALPELGRALSARGDA